MKCPRSAIDLEQLSVNPNYVKTCCHLHETNALLHAKALFFSLKFCKLYTDTSNTNDAWLLLFLLFQLMLMLLLMFFFCFVLFVCLFFCLFVCFVLFSCLFCFVQLFGLFCFVFCFVLFLLFFSFCLFVCLFIFFSFRFVLFCFCFCFSFSFYSLLFNRQAMTFVFTQYITTTDKSHYASGSLLYEMCKKLVQNIQFIVYFSWKDK